jgi:hypothetical protein
MVLGQLNIHIEKKKENFEIDFTHYEKTNSRRIVNLNVKHETL